MKFYINYNSEQKPLPKLGKAAELSYDGGIPVHEEFDPEKVPEDKVLVVVEDFGSFDVAYVTDVETIKELQYAPANKFKLLLYDLETAHTISGISDYFEK